MPRGASCERWRDQKVPNKRATSQMGLQVARLFPSSDSAHTFFLRPPPHRARFLPTNGSPVVDKA
eukprot:CAMPEP_0172630674 /NCGR_PEP_ID=MMETSP1068-20121228/174913_1 /TAXON_ID=35684 /ORGANISM="Pseudopedinella elastica, Strain CCMP716" /LENGTH=64 /DNA_ID=CAMNT_0013441583 /DNA_START=15 /DNA_END=205 /DNA_ORIENTATION=+